MKNVNLQTKYETRVREMKSVGSENEEVEFHMKRNNADQASKHMNNEEDRNKAYDHRG